MSRNNPVIRFVVELWDGTALGGTLVLSFSLWILWGLFWFPVIDWFFEALQR